MQVQKIISKLNVYNLYEECYPTEVATVNGTKSFNFNTFQPLMFTRNPYVLAQRQVCARAEVRFGRKGHVHMKTWEKQGTM